MSAGGLLAVLCSSCMSAASEFKTCEWCDASFCERCFPAHDCFGHEPEIVFCGSCSAACEVSESKLGYETRPALINGDPICPKCAFEKPWVKKDPEL